MSSDSGETEALIRRVEGGDEAALSDLFARYRDRLRRMVKLRMDRRLQGVSTRRTFSKRRTWTWRSVLLSTGRIPRCRFSSGSA